MKTACTFLLVLVLCGPVAAQDLPPDILADQYLLAATKALESGNGEVSSVLSDMYWKRNELPPKFIYFAYGKFLVENGRDWGDLRKGQRLLELFVLSIEQDSKRYTPTLELLSLASRKLEDAREHEIASAISEDDLSDIRRSAPVTVPKAFIDAPPINPLHMNRICMSYERLKFQRIFRYASFYWGEQHSLSDIYPIIRCNVLGSGEVDLLRFSLEKPSTWISVIELIRYVKLSKNDVLAKVMYCNWRYPASGTNNFFERLDSRIKYAKRRNWGDTLKDLEQIKHTIDIYVQEFPFPAEDTPLNGLTPDEYREQWCQENFYLP